MLQWRATQHDTAHSSGSEETDKIGRRTGAKISSQDPGTTRHKQSVVAEIGGRYCNQRKQHLSSKVTAIIRCKNLQAKIQSGGPKWKCRARAQLHLQFRISHNIGN